MLSQRLTDLMQSTAADDDIKFFFITNNGSIDEATDEMKLSFQVGIVWSFYSYNKDNFD